MAGVERDEAFRSLVQVGVCGDGSAAPCTLGLRAQAPSYTHTTTLPRDVAYTCGGAPRRLAIGDAFDLAHPPLPVLRTGAARRLLKALCPFWEGCCCCRLRATGNAITPSPRDGGSGESYLHALHPPKASGKTRLSTFAASRRRVAVSLGSGSRWVWETAPFPGAAGKRTPAQPESPSLEGRLQRLVREEGGACGRRERAERSTARAPAAQRSRHWQRNR